MLCSRLPSLASSVFDSRPHNWRLSLRLCFAPLETASVPLRSRRTKREPAREEGAKEEKFRKSALQSVVDKEEEKNSRPKEPDQPSHLRPERRQERAPDLRLHFLRQAHPLRCEDGLLVLLWGKVYEGESEDELHFPCRCRRNHRRRRRAIDLPPPPPPPVVHHHHRSTAFLSFPVFTPFLTFCTALGASSAFFRISPAICLASAGFCSPPSSAASAAR